MDKAWALIKRIGGLSRRLWENFQDWRKSSKAADEATEAVSCETDNSFTPDTKVLMADGSTKKIKDVDIGDEVLATDPETGETKAETVTAEIKGKGLKHLVKLTIDTDGKKGSKTASVTATDGHPFWVPELGEWVDATDLKAGAWLRTGAGTRVQVTSVERWTVGSATVHNLTVSELHTYHVLAGATSLLVHNCGPSVDDLYSSALKPFRKPGGDHAASRSYQKHTKATGRDDSTLLPLTSGKDRKDMSEYLIEDLLTSPKSARRDYAHSDHGDVIEISLPDVGARWTSSGDFIGFIDHPSYR
jgi:hypothetical protein